MHDRADWNSMYNIIIDKTARDFLFDNHVAGIYPKTHHLVSNYIY